MPTELDELERGLRAGEPATEARARARMDEASRLREPDVVIRVGTALGTYLAGRGRLVAARETFERVVDAAERVGSAVAAQSARLRIASLCADAHEVDEAERLIGRVTAEPGLSEEMLVAAFLVRATLARRTRDVGRAREILEDARAATTDAILVARVDYHIGVHALDTGDQAEAEHRLRAALDQCSADQRPFVLLNLAEVERLRGRLDDAERLLEAASGERRHHRLAIAIPINRALIDRARGAPARALERLEALLSAPLVADVPWARFMGSALSAGLAADCGRPGRAQAHVRAAWALRARSHGDSDVVDALERAGTALADAAPSEAARARLLAARFGRPAPPRPGAPLPLGDIDLLRPIGRGGMGVVWEAVHPTTTARLAVKVVHAGQAGDALRDEIRKVAALDHPSVVPLVDAGEVDEATAHVSGGLLEAGAPWFAMPLYGGGSLGPWCGQLRWSRARAVLLDLLDGLGHAHARGVLHLDVKPDNVLLAASPDRGAAALSDFGIARAVGDAWGERRAGTPEFMAPEQWRGARDLGPWTDLYAMGALAWTLLCGAVPRSPSTRATALPPLAPGAVVPPGVAEWVAWLGAEHPSERPWCAEEAAAALRSLPDDPGAATPVGVERRAVPASDTLDHAADLDPSEPEAARAFRPAFRPRPSSPTAAARPRLGELGVQALPFRRPPLVGRDPEIAALIDALRSAADGGWAVVRIDGPRGVGRTALLAAAAERAHVAGFSVVAAKAGDTATVALHRFLRADGLDAEPLADQIRRAWPLVGPAAGLEAALAGDVVAALRAMATVRPVLLAADDLPSAPGVATVAAEVAGSSGVAVVAVGDRPLPDERRLAVAPLPDDTIHRLLGTLVAATPALAATTVARAGGLPAYVVDLLAQWSRRGALWIGPDGLAAVGGAALEPPASDGELALQRIEDLARGIPGAVDALEILAVLGPAARPGEWEDACARAGRSVPAALRARLAASGLEALPPRLADPLLERATRGGRRGAWARAAADSIRPDADALVRRGRLWLEAGEPARAVDPFLEEARSRLHAQDPAGALDLLDDLDAVPGRADLALVRSGALVKAGRPADGLRLLDSVDPATDPSRWSLIRASALLQLGRLEEAEGVLGAALAVPGLDTRASRRLRHTLALVRRDQGAPDEAIAVLQELVREGRGGAATDLARTLREAGRIDEARAVLDQVAPSRDGALSVAFQRALVAHALREPDVEARFREVLRLAPSRGLHARVATQWLALLAEERDRPADVLALLLPLRTDHPGAIALVVSATVLEPAGRCDAWIAELEAHPAPTRDPRTRAVLARAVARARGVGADTRADRLDALIRRDGGDAG